MSVRNRDLVFKGGWLDDHQPLSLRTFETPSLPIYKEALNA